MEKFIRHKISQTTLPSSTHSVNYKGTILLYSSLLQVAAISQRFIDSVRRVKVVRAPEAAIVIFLLVSNVYHHGLRHRLISCLCDRHAASEILMCTPIAALPSRYTVANVTTFHARRSSYVTRPLITIFTRRCRKTTVPSSIALIEVCACLTLLLLVHRRRSIKVVEHQVHVRSLFRL